MRQTNSVFVHLHCVSFMFHAVCSPIKGGLQQQGEGCDGRLAQAFPSDANRLECFSFSQCMFSFCGRERMFLRH